MSEVPDQTETTTPLEATRITLPRSSDTPATDVQLVTVQDVQRMLSIGRSKAYDLMAKGALERRHVDGCSRVTLKSVMAFVEGK